MAAAEALVLGMKVRCLCCVKAAGPLVLGPECCMHVLAAGWAACGWAFHSSHSLQLGEVFSRVQPCPHTQPPAASQLTMCCVCLLSGASQLGEDFHPALIQNPVLQRHYTVPCCRLRSNVFSLGGAMEGRRLPGSCSRSMAQRAAGDAMQHAYIFPCRADRLPGYHVPSLPPAMHLQVLEAKAAGDEPPPVEEAVEQARGPRVPPIVWPRCVCVNLTDIQERMVEWECFCFCHAPDGPLAKCPSPQDQTLPYWGEAEDEVEALAAAFHVGFQPAACRMPHAVQQRHCACYVARACSNPHENRAGQQETCLLQSAAAGWRWSHFISPCRRRAAWPVTRAPPRPPSARRRHPQWTRTPLLP